MLEKIFTSPRRCAELRGGPLGAHVDAFVAIELEEGFDYLTIREHLRVVERLGAWLGRRRLEAKDLDESRVGAFIRWRRRRDSPRRNGRRALARLLLCLREAGVTPPAGRQRPAPSGIDRVVLDFAKYLARDRGLARSTVSKYGGVVREFLESQFSARPVRFESLRSVDLQAFVKEAARHRSKGGVKDRIQGLRAFLRWLQARGTITMDLAAGLPGVASWRLSSVPPTLTPKEIRSLLRGCDRRTAKGRRDYAVLMLLARLGLRASEVTGLMLDDIDWRNAELTIRRKPGREDRLPIPGDVGKAVASYLRHARPTCPDRHVFLCTNAPRRALGHSSTVSSIVRTALDRAGLAPTRRGAHLLRHSLARQLLRRGATLAEIGDMLGHRSSGATEVYAKVDIASLRTVASPWPGGLR